MHSEQANIWPEGAEQLNHLLIKQQDCSLYND